MAFIVNRVYHAVTHAQIREMMDYDPETGILTWKVGNGKSVKPGDRVGCHRGDYLITKIKGVQLYVHRVIWFWMTGEDPDCEIDHWDQNKANNRWRNLRPATTSQNKANISGREDRGLRYFKTRGWEAGIMKEGVRYNLGCFPTKEEARRARREGELLHFGEFSPCSRR